VRPIFDFFLKTCILAILFWTSLALTGLAKQVDTRSIFFAWLISVLNACVGYLLYEHAYYKDNREFYKIVLGGHAARAIGVLISIAALILTKSVVKVEFILSFVALYFMHLILEILAYQKKNQFEKRSSS
jgi:UDP-N-acetylmuramyl pentapeptide phosphotransferase/UDP-N-acetylglucosamine-1-phosphate transferase